MRTIEEKMVEAINKKENFCLSNTQVRVEDNGTIFVYLCGYNICRIFADGTRLYSNCGWKTNITKSRLNALGANIHQCNLVWYNADGSEFVNQF